MQEIICSYAEDTLCDTFKEITEEISDVFIYKKVYT